MLFKYWVVCLLLFILFIQARASSFMPAVTNYLAKDYEAGYQNWACAQGSNGEMISATARGSWYMTVIAGLSTKCRGTILSVRCM